MDLYTQILNGFSVAVMPVNLMYAFLGALVGTVIGILPGIGPSASIAMLLPVTFGLPPVGAVIMLAGIYYGAMYGGSTTSILVNIPGEAASTVTCIDGYKMALQGRAGPALGIAVFGSFIAGTIGVIGLTLFSFPLVSVALDMGPPEYVILIIVGLILSASLAARSKLKSIVMVLLGLGLGTVGVDPTSGLTRLTFGIDSLMGGFDFVPVVIGLFGLSEILANLASPIERVIISTKLANLFPTKEDWKKSILPIIRGSFLGFFLGILPGGGAIMGSFLSYVLEKKVSKHPEKFGHGAIEGVAGPESANNSATAGAFIPLMTLGMPFNSATALILAALMIHGIRPGPLLISERPDVFWGVISSMYIGNIMLLILNLPLIGVFVQLLRVRYSILFPFIILFCIIGSFSVNNNIADTFIMIAFGILGYFLRKADFEPAPLILALILGPMLEVAFRQSLIISRGSLSIFITRPLCLFFVIVLVAFLSIPIIWRWTKTGGK